MGLPQYYDPRGLEMISFQKTHLLASTFLHGNEYRPYNVQIDSTHLAVERGYRVSHVPLKSSAFDRMAKTRPQREEPRI